MPTYLPQEPTVRSPIVNVMLEGPLRSSRALVLPMNKYVRGLNMEWGVNSSFSVRILLFDPDFDIIERYIHTGGLGTRCVYSFGWRDLIVSREYQGLIRTYGTSITPGGTELEFTIQSPNAAKGAARPTVHFGRMSVEQAVRKACTAIGIPEQDQIIEPTDKTPLLIPDLLGYDGMTFIRWLEEITPLARSQQGADYGAYSWAFDPDGAFRFTTQSRADRFHTRLYDAYVYGFANDGRVMNMSLLDQRVLISMLGGEFTSGSSFDTAEAQLLRTDIDPETGLLTTVNDGPGNAPVAADQDVPYTSWAVNDIVESDIEARLRATSQWRLYNTYNFQIQMQILGDPHLRWGDFIYIRVVKRDGTPHFLSGYYSILNITHEISQGNFTSTLRLIRRASYLGDLERSNVTVTEELGLSEIGRGLPSIDVSPAYRFQLRRHHYLETQRTVEGETQAVSEVGLGDVVDTLELSNRITARIPDYTPPILTKLDSVPSRLKEVESE